jgi:hypothetical protein
VPERLLDRRQDDMIYGAPIKRNDALSFRYISLAGRRVFFAKLKPTAD